MDKSISAAPLAAVKSAEQRFGGDVWQLLDACENAKSEGIVSYPSYCPLPIAAAMEAIVYKGFTRTDAAIYASTLIALWAWRKDKIIYQFDADLADALAETGIDGFVPVDTLLHLPRKMIYIQSTAIHSDFCGFFGWIEFDDNRLEPELRVEIIGENLSAHHSLVMHLKSGRTVEDCVELAMLEVRRNLVQYDALRGVEIDVDAEKRFFTETFAEIIPLLLYLCTDEPDITYHPAERTRQRPRDTPSEVAVSEVGVRIGAAFRRARDSERTSSVSTGAGGTVRPHARRGHWHHFWTGPRDGERKLILKWVSPLIVHGDKLKGDDVTVVPVKEGKSDDR